MLIGLAMLVIGFEADRIGGEPVKALLAEKHVSNSSFLHKVK